MAVAAAAAAAVPTPPAMGISDLEADPLSSLCLHLLNRVVVSSGSSRSLFTASEVDRADRRSRVRSTLRASIAASDIALAGRATPNTPGTTSASGGLLDNTAACWEPERGAVHSPSEQLAIWNLVVKKTKYFPHLFFPLRRK